MRVVKYVPSLGIKRYHEQIGVACEILAKTAERRMLPIAFIPTWIMPPLRLRQAGFFFNEYTVPVGYLTWAFLQPDTAERWRSGPLAPLHESEWDEGGELWLIDMVVVPAWRRPVFRYVRDVLFASQIAAHHVSRSGSGGAGKVFSWRRDVAA